MSAGNGHLAQLNVGRLLAPTDDPRVAEFMGALDRIKHKRTGRVSAVAAE